MLTWARFALVSCFLMSTNAMASGMVLHMWMADQALSWIEDQDLKDLLEEQRSAYLYGSIFPDSGYAIGHPYGEYAHWDGFMNAYHEVLGQDCPDLTTATCRALYAHFLGSVSHSLGDINFDSLFVTAAAQADYEGDVTTSHKLLDTGLDMIAMIEHGRALVQPILRLPVETLVKTFQRVAGVTVGEKDLRAGARLHRLGMASEPLAATISYHHFKSKLPWASAQLVDAPGGINDTARKIAATWLLLWRGRHSEFEKSAPFVTHPKWPHSDFWVYGKNLHDL